MSIFLRIGRKSGSNSTLEIRKSLFSLTSTLLGVKILKDAKFITQNCSCSF